MSLKQEKRRPEFIQHWTQNEEEEGPAYPDSDEIFTIGSALGESLGLKKIGIHHERVLPGRRTSYPHAEKDEEEFVYVLKGTPDVWINGKLYRLEPGDAVGFPAGTGICHTVINNTDSEVRLLVVGEKSKPEHKIWYPLNLEYQKTISRGWDFPPEQVFGEHDGKPDKNR
ncbi:cupin domain-containing protein [Xenorhabdus budapestensis]|uniref:Cupin n=1 Tax=Xenorhabdus budapestensis TaxID=290110 RepID=A0A2D0J3T8_XENBU|nr:cupin domain-containing protein [Xenorhabdus budapestensis]PHM29155.1 cupin [Xenorhabdus budapestensis]QTL41407.1 cupin domain-containing protein [Xenorhabdus budapestensis]